MSAVRTAVRVLGRVSAVCTGWAQAFREAADNIEEVLMDSLELWEQYERQTSDGRR